MLEGLYSAASGMEAQQHQLDAVANDLANMDTPGYQGEVLGFQDLLYSSGEIGSSTVATGAGSKAEMIGRNQTQGSTQPTGRTLDVAIQGEGYLEFRMPDGTIGLSRDGVLEIGGQGQLTNQSGLLLQPPITLPRGASIDQLKIASDGTVTVGSRQLGKIGLVTVPAPDGLVAAGNGMFSPTTASGAVRTANGSTLQQGALEGSNVNVSQAMTEMINAQQNYAMGSKAIDFENQMLQIADGIKP
jgi:flagellar basal-body rod protein FlgG